MTEEVVTREEIEIEARNIKDAASVFKALNHKLRQQILALVHDNRRMRVTPIFRTLRQEQSVISTHLGILRKAGILIAQKEARNVFYSVNYKRLKELGEIASQLLTYKVNAARKVADRKWKSRWD